MHASRGIMLCSSLFLTGRKLSTTAVLPHPVLAYMSLLYTRLEYDEGGKLRTGYAVACRILV